jgi:hypothetical protein
MSTAAAETPVKNGDSVLIKRSGSQIWINVIALRSNDKIVGNTYDHDEPIVITTEEIVDIFNEESAMRKYEEIIEMDTMVTKMKKLFT